MDNNQVEKVYVILGNDLQDGFKTLDWTVKKWKSNSISIVILHLTYNISKDFVYTQFGKLPASSMSEEKLQVLRKYEQEKIEKLLNKFIIFCGKVKAEILKVEKSDEPIEKEIIDLISRHKITKLVMGLTFLKSSSWKSKNAISGSFYIHRHKPNFCEFYIICGRKLVIIREENEEAIMEDDQGNSVTRKGNIKSWIGKILHEHNSLRRYSDRLSASSKGLDSFNSRKQWENCVLEIQNYYEKLLSSNLDEEICEKENEDIMHSLEEPTTSIMKSRIEETKKFIQLKKEEVKANVERSTKAEWAINLCNTRVEELEAKIKEEVSSQVEIKKRLDIEKEEIQEIKSDITENKNKLKSILELQTELKSKFQQSTVTRSHVEAQLENAVIDRAEMVREIEELRRQRDVLQRRVEFCKEKDAIGMVTKLNELSCGYREYSSQDIILATDNFSENLRLKSGGDWTNVYRGRLHNSTVAIKLLNSDKGLSQQHFLTKVKFLNNIRHPHLVALMGFCSDQKSIIFEYMHCGSLREILFSSQRNHGHKNRVIVWHDRIRIAHEVCSGLAYLHMAKPRPIVHGHLTVSNILLDRNQVAKISGLWSISQYQSGSDTRHDIRGFGVLLLHLLTGRNWAGLVEDAIKMDRGALVGVLDELAGQWPLDLAEQLVRIAMKCMPNNYDPNTDFSVTTIMEELDGVRKSANEIVARGGCEAVAKGSGHKQESGEVPANFLCPIFKDVMENPHLAADGFSYELEAIEEWLRTGHDTSPLTNLRLKHKLLTPNHTLRSLIQEWENNSSS